MIRRLARFRQRFGIAGRKVAVRTELAWYWRWLGILVILAAAFALAAWMYETGRRFAGFDQRELQQQIRELERQNGRVRDELKGTREELESLRAATAASESRLAIERSAQHKLAQQIKLLERENARLREELATFESLLASEARVSKPLSIHRLTVQPDVLPGEYRYRLLLLTGTGRREQQFQGRLELVVSLTEGGKDAMMVIPEATGDAAPAFRLSFKYFHRVEGSFRVSPKAKVKGVQVRVYEGKAAQARATADATIE
ncbi:MAG: hypothetical protein AMJ64_01005 [Betaproteobacteria bacterium SG8_39]|nr:MAG: hypothetical protein AMJ64_01005 [Betaproteobacteria bacterium SG8_39]